MSVSSIGSGLSTQIELPREFKREGNAQVLPGQAVAQNDDAAKQPQSAENREYKPQILDSTTADLERVSLVFNKKLQFIVDQSSNQVIVKVIDKETDKVIKELPPEELQRLHNNLKETIGFLFDERV